MENKSISTLSVLGIVFVVLKITDVIDWPWIWVTMPFWIGFALFFFFILVAVVIGAIQHFKELLK